MRKGLLIFVATLATCSFGYTDEPKFSTTSEPESSLKALVERLEARIDELETQVQQLKYAQQQSVIGGGLLELIERPTRGQYPVHFGWGSLTNLTETMRVDPTGTIRDARGKPLGHWGVDFTTQDMTLGPNPSR